MEVCGASQAGSQGEPGDPVRYAVQLHVQMSQAQMEVWESLADRRRLEVDDVVHAAALSELKYQLKYTGERSARTWPRSANGS